MEEIILPLPRPLLATTHVRSTLICASIQSIRARGYHDAYLSALGDSDREEILSLTAGTWLAAKTAVTHYMACDRAPIPHAERIEIGGEVARRIQQSVLHVLVRLSREVGASPWSVITRAEKLREQTWKGGGIQAKKLGPKDAVLEWHQQSCARSEHFRAGFVGIVKGLLEMFCRKAFVSEVKRRCNDTTVAIHASWV